MYKINKLNLMLLNVHIMYNINFLLNFIYLSQKIFIINSKISSFKYIYLLDI